ncbi:MAG: hypothetical protein IJZ35_04740 [Clostridia bacterium]|nr:hypothetical protein [Clostridia bacterium]
MKKTFKAIVAVVMCATMLFSTVVGVSAASTTADEENAVMASVAQVITTGLNKAVDALLNFVSGVLPATVKVEDPSAYAAYADDNFYAGTEEFIDEPAEGAQWKLGYADASILPADFSTGKYYKGGYDINLQLSECIDDLKVRVIALDDGSGRGITVFAVVDCLGLANDDVRNIRAAVAEALPDVEFTSINVSATHVHSGIDTQGIYTDTFGHVIKNLIAAITGSDDLCDPVDTDLLATIQAQTAACVKEAVAEMTTGTLEYAKTDISDYVRDRTDPEIMLDDMYCLIFNPDNGDASTVISNFGVHPECIGYGTQLITSDFVYYTEETLNKAGYNYMFIEGAVGTYTEENGKSGDGLDLDRVEATIRYGHEVGNILIAVATGMTEEEIAAAYAAGVVYTNDYTEEALATDNCTIWYEGWEAVTTEKVAPILNIKLKAMTVDVKNGVYKAFGKLSLANNVMYEDADGNVTASTEIGYMELGENLKVILCPGETYAELIVGGENMADFSLDCAYDVMAEEGEDILVFDLMNDALGYIMPDNDFVYFRMEADFALADSWGLTSIGANAASDVYGAIYDLYGSVR